MVSRSRNHIVTRHLRGYVLWIVCSKCRVERLWLQVDPKFLRNLRFAKKHNKKGSQKMDTS